MNCKKRKKGHPHITVINYADQAFSKAQLLNSKSAFLFGKADAVIEYGPSCIDRQFEEAHRDILSIKMGGGCWLWKPYIVCDALKKMNPGDYIFYLDSGALFRRSIIPFVSFMESNNLDMLCFSTPFAEEQWTKKQLLKKFDVDHDMDDKGLQTEATYFLIKKTDKMISFFDEWLKLCCMKENIDNSGLNSGENHRNDQSVFSCLCRMYGYRSYRSPSNRYFPDSFENELVQFYKNQIENDYYKNEYKKIPVIQGTQFSVFCHGLKNTKLFYAKVLYLYVHAWNQFRKSDYGRE